MEALDGVKYPTDQILPNELELNPDVCTTAQNYFDRGFVFDFPPSSAIAGARGHPDMIENVANAVAHAKVTISPENLEAVQHIVDSCNEAPVGISGKWGQKSVFHKGEDNHYFTSGPPEPIIWVWH
ncbi:hypothetical protein BGZ60DRAFT_426887 [Tricladium varicosporioides]|nr:hypothetical protein BGZ60DRAFT_426887 [Hymenoscyphus varicosporioides]